MDQDTRFLPDLPPVEGRYLHADFDGGALSSDGGVPVLRHDPALKMACERLPDDVPKTGLAAHPVAA